MTVAVHANTVHGKDAVAASISKVQVALSLPVNKTIDGQQLGQQIIALQKSLNAAGKFPSNKINRTIDDQHLSARLVEVETAANT